jgi:hypothetical protein
MKFGFTYVDETATDKLRELGIQIERSESGYTVISIVDEQDVRGVKVWLNPETDVYYYLIRDNVFKMHPNRTKDYSTDPPTVLETSILRLSEDKNEYRSVLENRPPEIWRPI